MPQDDQHPFLKTVRDCAAARIASIKSPKELAASEETTNLINDLSNWELLQLLAEAESKD